MEKVNSKRCVFQRKFFFHFSTKFQVDPPLKRSLSIMFVFVFVSKMFVFVLLLFFIVIFLFSVQKRNKNEKKNQKTKMQNAVNVDHHALLAVSMT